MVCSNTILWVILSVVWSIIKSGNWYTPLLFWAALLLGMKLTTSLAGDQLTPRTVTFPNAIESLRCGSTCLRFVLSCLPSRHVVTAPPAPHDHVATTYAWYMFLSNQSGLSRLSRSEVNKTTLSIFSASKLTFHTLFKPRQIVFLVTR